MKNERFRNGDKGDFILHKLAQLIGFHFIVERSRSVVNQNNCVEISTHLIKSTRYQVSKVHWSARAVTRLAHQAEQAKPLSIRVLEPLRKAG